MLLSTFSFDFFFFVIFLVCLIQGIELSPSLLPLAGAALKVPAPAYFVGAAGSLGAAFALISLIPDDSTTNIGLQVYENHLNCSLNTLKAIFFLILITMKVFAGIPLGVILPGALVVGGGVLSKLK